jgi:hypothetical protein
MRPAKAKGEYIMAELSVGQQIKILVPLVISKIGTADIEVEYPAGGINKKLYIPKNIVEGIDNQQRQTEYKCDICGKICTAKIALAGHKRSHKSK